MRAVPGAVHEPEPARVGVAESASTRRSPSSVKQVACAAVRPHTIGLLYSVFTAFLGFEVNEGEYKVMGMAPFGQPRHVELIRRIVEFRDDGSLWLDPAYVSFLDHTERSFTRKLGKLFGTPRDPRARFVTRQTSLYDDANPPPADELARNHMPGLWRFLFDVERSKLRGLYLGGKSHR